jgi:hypothetical protein
MMWGRACGESNLRELPPAEPGIKGHTIFSLSNLFRQEGLLFYPITITGGENVNSEGRRINVPKRDLVASLKNGQSLGRVRAETQLEKEATIN